MPELQRNDFIAPPLQNNCFDATLLISLFPLSKIYAHVDHFLKYAYGFPDTALEKKLPLMLSTIPATPLLTTGVMSLTIVPLFQIFTEARSCGMQFGNDPARLIEPTAIGYEQYFSVDAPAAM